MNDIIFKIGPRINASGRMQNGKMAVSLLIEKDPVAAHRKAKLINDFNEQRKDLDKSMTEQANRIVEGIDHQNEPHSIVIYNEQWHRGLIGIVASRPHTLFIHCPPHGAGSKKGTTRNGLCAVIRRPSRSTSPLIIFGSPAMWVSSQ